MSNSTVLGMKMWGGVYPPPYPPRPLFCPIPYTLLGPNLRPTYVFEHFSAYLKVKKSKFFAKKYHKKCANLSRKFFWRREHY